jgi:hypothetical protein
MAGTSAGLGLAQAGMQYAGQSQLADAQQQAIHQNLMNEYQQGQQQTIYHDNEASQKLQENLRQSRAAMGTMNATAAENGTGGHSMSALANELSANAGMYASTVEQNRQMSDLEIQQQMQGFQAQAQSSMNQVQQPDPFGLLIGGADAGLGAASNFLYIKPNSSMPNGGWNLPKGLQ